MAKWKTVKVGSVMKAKEDGKAPYIKLADGTIIGNLESKSFKLKSLQEGIKSGRVNSELAEKIAANIEKMPDFVLGDIVRYEKQD